MKKLGLLLAFLAWSSAAAFAACTPPAVMHDFPGTSFNMSLIAGPDGNCTSVNSAVPAIGVSTGTGWTSGTAGNTTQALMSAGGWPAIAVQLNQTSTISGGAVTFEGTYDGTNWVSVPVAQVLNPNTLAPLTNPYTLVASTNQPFVILAQGYQQVRLKLSTVITGSATVTPQVALLPYNPTVAALLNPLVAGSAIIGKVGIDQTTPGTTNGVVVNNGPANVTATDCSGTISSGGAAQNAFTAQSTLHGFTILNFDTTEPLWISFTGTAAANTTGSYPLQAATASTFAGAGNFTSPFGFGLNHAVSVIAATTSHKFSCTWW
jgi:hypothetical protein